MGTSPSIPIPAEMPVLRITATAVPESTSAHDPGLRLARRNRGRARRVRTARAVASWGTLKKLVRKILNLLLTRHKPACINLVRGKPGRKSC